MYIFFKGYLLKGQAPRYIPIFWKNFPFRTIPRFNNRRLLRTIFLKDFPGKTDEFFKVLCPRTRYFFQGLSINNRGFLSSSVRDCHGTNQMRIFTRSIYLNDDILKNLGISLQGLSELPTTIFVGVLKDYRKSKPGYFSKTFGSANEIFKDFESTNMNIFKEILE